MRSGSERFDDDGDGAFGGALFVGEENGAAVGEGEKGGEAGIGRVRCRRSGREGRGTAGGDEVGPALEEYVGGGAERGGDGLGTGAEGDLGGPGLGEEDGAGALPDRRKALAGSEDGAAIHRAGLEEPGAGAEFVAGEKAFVPARRVVLHMSRAPSTPLRHMTARSPRALKCAEGWQHSQTVWPAGAR